MSQTVILFVFLAVLVTLASADCSACQDDKSIGECNSYSLSEDAFCSCHSGLAGVNCDASFNEAKCTPPTATATSTDFVPKLTLMDFNNDLLRIELQSNYVKNRYSTHIAIDGSSPSASKCHYPGAGWTKSNDDDLCADVYTSSLKWAEISGDECGWTFDDESDEDYFIYKAQLTVTHKDLLDAPLRDSTDLTRTTVHTYPIRINFPKHVSMSTAITAQARVTVQTAVISQVASSLEKKAKVIFVTNTLYPYKLTAANVGAMPEIVDAKITEITDGTCLDDAATTCTQKWEVAIDAKSACVVSGAYHFDYKIVCQENGAKGCALDANTDAASVDIVIKSEDFCAETSTDIEVGATLKAYRDAERTIEADQFFAGATVYWRLQAHSANASVDDVNLASAAIYRSDTTQPTTYVYAANKAQESGDTFTITKDGNGVDFVDFQFDIAPANGFDLNVDDVFDYNIVARLDVSYSGVDDVAHKRTILVAQSVNEKVVTARETFTVSPLTPLGSAAAVHVASAAFVLLAIIFAI